MESGLSWIFYDDIYGRPEAISAGANELAYCLWGEKKHLKKSRRCFIWKKNGKLRLLKLIWKRLAKWTCLEGQEAVCCSLMRPSSTHLDCQNPWTIKRVRGIMRLKRHYSKEYMLPIKIKWMFADQCISEAGTIDIYLLFHGSSCFFDGRQLRPRNSNPN